MSRQLLVFFGQLRPHLGPLGRFVPTVGHLKRPPVNVPGLEPVSIVPRLGEGGALVKYALPDDITPSDALDSLRKAAKPRMAGLLRPRVFTVLGKPWTDDMPHAVGRKLLVNFHDGHPLLPENLYTLLRPYGVIRSIVEFSNGSNTYEVTFARATAAIAARNCVHGFKPGTDNGAVRLEFAPHTNVVRGWLSKHPRISIPALLAMLLTVAYAIWEPVREFSVGHRIKQRLSINTELSGSDVVPGPCRDLATLLTEDPQTFVIVTGPRGSGKSRVIDWAIKNADVDNGVLSIDFEKLRRSKSEDEALTSLAEMLGYRPRFWLLNTIGQFADLAIQSIAGPGVLGSTRLHETPEQQAQRMLGTAEAACRRLATGSLPQNTDDDVERLMRRKPVVVVQEFGPSHWLSPVVARWAADVLKEGIAQVIFVTQEGSWSQELSEALPTSVFRVVPVGNASEVEARNYVRQACAGNPVASEAFESVSEDVLRTLGGRLTDLQKFTRLLLAGEPADTAVRAMVYQSALDVTQNFLLGHHPEWTRQQVWVLARILGGAAGPETWVSYPHVLKEAPVFSDEVKASEALKELERRGLVQLRTVGSRLTAVRPGKSLYHAAFRSLVNDPYVSSIEDAQLLTFYIAGAKEKIRALGKDSADIPSQARDSQRDLLDEIQTIQQQLVEWKADLRLLKLRSQTLHDSDGKSMFE